MLSILVVDDQPHILRVIKLGLSRKGQNVDMAKDGFEALEPNILAAFEKYTPEIFDLENWTETRFDEIDYFQLMQEKRARGEV